jgi:hypothetical protein
MQLVAVLAFCKLRMRFCGISNSFAANFLTIFDNAFEMSLLRLSESINTESSRIQQRILDISKPDDTAIRIFTANKHLYCISYVVLIFQKITATC